MIDILFYWIAKRLPDSFVFWVLIRLGDEYRYDTKLFTITMKYKAKTGNPDRVLHNLGN